MSSQSSPVTEKPGPGAHRLTGDPRHRRSAEGIYRYALRDMVHEEGAFFSAEDADSEGEEGLFYLWDPQEIDLGT